MTILRRLAVGFFIAAAAPRAFAFDIPQGLNDSDRHEIVRTLGLNVATKMLDNPYPLGGYSGFEVGWSLEFVDIRSLHRLGCAPGTAGCTNSDYSDESEWRYSRITIGKGLYEDIDVFFNFIPPVGSVGISDYGGALRWSFYQARFLPINISAVAHFDQLNYKDTFTNRNIGGDVLMGVNVDNFALYFGGGYIEASGTFSPSVVAQDGSLDPGTNTANDKVSTTHTVVGINFSYDNLFAAAEVDRYQDAVYSFKAGVRF